MDEFDPASDRSAHPAAPRPAPVSAVSAVSRRGVLAGAAGGVAALGIGLTGATARAATGPTPTPSTNAATSSAFPGRPRTFVAVRGGFFTLDNRPFRFAGTNTYYLHQQSHYMIDAALNDAKAMGLSVVRAWAFADGSGQSYTPLQPSPYVYDDDAFDALDYAIWKAGTLGIRLVLPLVNNWSDYGGMSQYVTWFLGLPDDSLGEGVNHDRFYTTTAIKDCYKAWVRHITHRRNPYTGLRYNADPTIMTWQLGNEPRCRSDKSGSTLLGWVQEMSGWIRRQAPRQLVAVGDEGFYGEAGHEDYPYSDYEGARWKDFIALPTIDYGTAHIYAVPWGETTANGKDPVAWGTRWIRDHIADAEDAGKPFVLEEYGLVVGSDPAVPDEDARLAAYTRWTRTIERAGYSASDQFWILTSRVDDGSLYPDYDGYRVVWWNDDTANPTNALAKMLAAHAKRMARAPKE